MVIVDDLSRYIWIYFLRHRSDAFESFKEFKIAVENQLNTRLSILRIDNAPELIRGPLEQYCKDTGVQYEKIVPDASQQNGVAEAANRIVASMTRAMLIDANVADWFWPMAAQAAVHIKNRVPHSSIPRSMTPFTILFDKKPDLSHLRRFGCLVTSHKLNSDDLNKVEPRGEEGVFMGYAKDARGYLIWFPHRHGILVRRDLTFHDLPIPPKPIPLDRSPLWDDIFGEEAPHIEHPETLPIRDDVPYVSLYMSIRIYIHGSIDPLLQFEKLYLRQFAMKTCMSLYI
jgi:hypothetical protein